MTDRLTDRSIYQPTNRRKDWRGHGEVYTSNTLPLNVDARMDVNLNIQEKWVRYNKNHHADQQDLATALDYLTQILNIRSRSHLINIRLRAYFAEACKGFSNNKCGANFFRIPHLIFDFLVG